MQVGELAWVSGYVTKEKFIKGRRLVEIEGILGYHAGRFAQGATFIKLNRLPLANEFELAAYSNVAEHRYRQPTDLDIPKIKKMAAESWSLAGFERLVKVRPRTAHNDDMAPDLQYPPGDAAPQWKLTALLPGMVVAVENTYPDGRYQPLL
jgi:hypothetical protein